MLKMHIFRLNTNKLSLQSFQLDITITYQKQKCILKSN